MLLWKQSRTLWLVVSYGFQSLFSWMLLWKWPYPRTQYTGPSSFNPCSLGCCSERPDPKPVRACGGRFQSLFSWMLLWKSASAESVDLGTRKVSILVLLDVALKAGIPRCRTLAWGGFNPCSLGCEAIKSTIWLINSSLFSGSMRASGAPCQFIWFLPEIYQVC